MTDIATLTRAVDRLSKKVEERETQDAINAGTMQRIETALLKLVKVCGEESEDEYGKKTGTGLSGRVMRLEMGTRSLTQKWQGIVMAASVSGLVLWWLLEGKLSAVLK